MDDALIAKIKENLKTSLSGYLKNFEYKNAQPLDLLIPEERKIRSVVGGLETSMGTTLWEPLSKTLAANNGFEVLNEKILKPKPMPVEMAQELAKLIADRETPSTWISSGDCISRFREVSKRMDRTQTTYVKPPAGTGVDIFLKKENRYYAFDTKTVQPNLSSIKSFNKQLLEWYAYSIFKNPDVDIVCMIAYPYNPHQDNFWTHTPHTSGILEPKVDAVVENEYWDMISGVKNTYQIIINILIELNLEGFGGELSSLIKQIKTPVRNVV